jgi:thioredoxin-related protein
MKTLFLLIFISTSLTTFSQNDSAEFIQKPILPVFTLLKTDSTIITQDVLAKGKKTLIFFFHPECHHCQHLTDSIKAHINEFTNTQILMITYAPYEKMKDFYKDFQLAKYNNLIMGRDIYYFLVHFFNIRGVPFTALYNEEGKLVNAFKGPIPVERLISAFKENLIQ